MQRSVGKPKKSLRPKTSRDELDCVSIAGSAMSTSYGSHDARTNSSEMDTQVTYIGQPSGLLSFECNCVQNMSKFNLFLITTIGVNLNIRSLSIFQSCLWKVAIRLHPALGKN